MPRTANTYYELEGSGPDMVFIHGVGCGADDWIPVSRQLQDRFRVLRYDLRGHGRSVIPDTAWTMDDFIDDLADLLDALDIDSAHVAGFSLGGIIAQGFAIKHPDRVNQLCLVSTTTGRTPAEIDKALERLSIIQQSPLQEYFDKSIDRWYTGEFQQAQPDTVKRNGATIANMNRAAYASAYRILVESNFRDQLKQIQAQTLVMTGEHDIGSPPHMSRTLAEHIPNADSIILPRLRHNVLMEAPEIVGGLIREFCTQPK